MIALIILIACSLQTVVYSRLVHVQQVTRHGITAPSIQYLQEYYPYGPSILTPAGIRQMFLLGVSMRKRYIIDNVGFLDESIIEKQFKVVSSESVRTLKSGDSFIQGFLPMNSSAGPKLSSRQSLSLNIKDRGFPPLNIDQQILQQDLLNYSMPQGDHPYFVQQFGGDVHDRLNLFSCYLLKDMHLYLQTTAAEDTIWKSSHTHFNKTGIYDVMANSLSLNPKLFEYLGFHFAYSMSTLLLSLQEQMGDLPFLQNITYRDWDQIQRLQVTHQYGTYSQWMMDLKLTRTMKMFIATLDAKIACILTNGVNNCSSSMVQYEHYFEHDVEIQVFHNWFEVEQQYDKMKYAGFIIIELHYDGEQNNSAAFGNQTLPTQQCVGESCFNVKLFANNEEINMHYCSYLTQKCPYTEFKRQMMNKMIQDIDSDAICYEKFNPLSLSRHRVHLI